MSGPYYLNDLGIICPLGHAAREVTRRLFAGESGLVDTDRYSPGRTIPVGIVDAVLPAHEELAVAMRSRNNLLALAAAQQIAPAIAAAADRYGAHRVAVVIGTSTSGIGESEHAIAERQRSGAFPGGFHYAQQELGSSAHALADAYGLGGPTSVISTACASSAKAMASAARLIALGLADAVVTGGVDTLCGFTVAGFEALDLVSDRRCNPLSLHRGGINLGEAAALFLMTREPSAVSLRGWGETTDGYHFSAPDPSGEGARTAMELALKRAGESAANVEYINLHGTGTRHNDSMESESVHALFGEHVPVSSTKPLTGHTLGAAGALEAAFCWLAMQDSNVEGRLPPHLWDGARDPALHPLCVASAGTALGHAPRRVLSNSFAFGGANAALVFARE